MPLLSERICDKMRKLKFRVWDETCGCYVQSGVQFNNSTMELESIPKQTIEQFTGLFDKQGKEIYEGDKITAIFGEQTIDYVCEWYDEIGAWVFRGNGEWLMFEDIFDDNEIIGTIHDKENSK